ncbi:MAG: hypothetical protein IKH44_07915 [Bacteroidales bacterium]|jgi:hypothetical protein|nr:hypothetical protein [Bacteroidales bacterium]
MKKMNVYMAPEAEVIEMNVNATVLTNSSTGELSGQNPGWGGSWNK